MNNLKIVHVKIFVSCIIFFAKISGTILLKNLKQEQFRSYSEINKKNDSQSEYSIVSYASIPLDKFVIVKSENSKPSTSRTVYLDKKNNLFIKIWDKSYSQIPHFLNAFEKNFYLDLTTLKALVYDDQKICRGYITYLLNLGFAKNLIIKNNVIEPDNLNNNDFKRFFEILCRKTELSKIIYYDLVPDNIFYNGINYYIIDLEPVIDFENFKTVPNIENSLNFNPPYYVSFLKKLLKVNNVI